jgi:hypothetical protein
MGRTLRALRFDAASPRGLLSTPPAAGRWPPRSTDRPTAKEPFVKVVLPIAGKGTRLRPHTHVTPKPLLKVGDKPVMSYILDDLQELGVDEAVFITGYLKEKVEQYVRDEYPALKAHFVEQPVQTAPPARSRSRGRGSMRSCSSSSPTCSSRPTSRWSSAFRPKSMA